MQKSDNLRVSVCNVFKLRQKVRGEGRRHIWLLATPTYTYPGCRCVFSCICFSLCTSLSDSPSVWCCMATLMSSSSCVLLCDILYNKRERGEREEREKRERSRRKREGKREKREEREERRREREREERERRA